ncbi:hypothetical protein HMPREF0105_1083 [Bacteroides sp. 3_1_33FAA]|uniref:Uncharacterized protein n=1 Tax=Phocaeicola dorei DSM 17855 TaxID=483217 RepID=B6W1J5_9BACT|nr:hypothetical protein BACDOR_03383 [Phocaeicola dorei DSM 17855]EEZ23700.1 hypothetical protein HMPREF0105_1083 [Bacteroides sp. 3_1_33FAA]
MGRLDIKKSEDLRNLPASILFPQNVKCEIFFEECDKSNKNIS